MLEENTVTVEQFLKLAKSLEWLVAPIGKHEYELKIYSPKEVELIICVNGSTIYEIIKSLEESYENYDVSREAHSLLDSTGHGVNEAPYHLSAILEEVETLHSMILDLLEATLDFKEIQGFISLAESLNWSVSTVEENSYELSTFSKAGQNLVITVEGEKISDIVESLDDVYENYDVSTETYLWLDSSGHGTNGAPYELRDVLEDMEYCEILIEELLDKAQELKEVMHEGM